MKKIIRIPRVRIRIPILESSACWRWFESLTEEFESLFQRVQIEESHNIDLNHYKSDSNLNSSKFV